MTIRCFLLTPTGRTVRSLRRYVGWKKDNEAVRRCTASGLSYHNARAPLDVVTADDAKKKAQVSGDLWPHRDRRWPKTCACGYRFKPSDEWQLFTEHEYRRSDTGETTTLSASPVGAIWLADWLKDSPGSPAHQRDRPGQPHLIVKTPAGDWDVDGRSSNNDGMGWTWTGEPPNVTANPSIGIGNPFRYHGWLRDGQLVDA